MTPRTPTMLRILVCLPALALCGWADPPPEGMRYFGTTADAPAAESALVLWGESDASRAARGVTTQPLSMRREDGSVRPDGIGLRGAYGAAVAPGDYSLEVLCEKSSRVQRTLPVVIAAKAGGRYLVRCAGKTTRQMRVDVIRE